MFDVYNRSLELVAQLAKLVPDLERRDRDLAKQLRRAASSTVLNIAEGSRREGGDRTYHYRVAAGSNAETRACLQAAAAWGHVAPAAAATALATQDRVAAMLYRLTR